METCRPDGELLVDIPHGGGQVVAGEEHSDRDALSSHWGAVHDLVPGREQEQDEQKVVRSRTWRLSHSHGRYWDHCLSSLA